MATDHFSSKRTSSRIAAKGETRVQYKDDSGSEDENVSKKIASKSAQRVKEEDDNFEELAPKKQKIAASKAKAKASTFKILDLPLEIVTCILSHCAPQDLAKMIFTNKAIYAILSGPSASKSVWQQSRRNDALLTDDGDVESVYPDPPFGLGEIQCALLLFTKPCTFCDAKATQVYRSLGVRLCASCRGENLRTSNQLASSKIFDYELFSIALRDGDRYLVPNFLWIAGQHERCKRQDDKFRIAVVPQHAGADDEGADTALQDSAESEPTQSAVSAHLKKCWKIRHEFDAFDSQVSRHEYNLQEAAAEVKEEKKELFKEAMIKHGVSLGYHSGDIEEALEHDSEVAKKANYAKIFRPSDWKNIEGDLVPLIEEERDHRLMYTRWVESEPVRLQLEPLFLKIEAMVGIFEFFPNRATFFDLDAVKELVDTIQSTFPELSIEPAQALAEEARSRLDDIYAEAEPEIINAVIEWSASLEQLLNVRLAEVTSIPRFAALQGLTVSNHAVTFFCGKCGDDIDRSDLNRHKCISQRVGSRTLHGTGPMIEAVMENELIKIDSSETVARVIVFQAILSVEPDTAQDKLIDVRGTFTCTPCNRTPKQHYVADPVSQSAQDAIKHVSIHYGNYNMASTATENRMIYEPNSATITDSA